MSLRTPTQAYQRSLANGFVQDPAQQRAVVALDACATAINAGRSATGVYLWGRVGRGKTWLMDIFRTSLTVPVRRQHHHHFMRWVHGRLFSLTGIADPLAAVATEIAAEVRVLCLDEFFVTDIGDAMILGPLIKGLLERGTVLVMTSNQPPSDIYAHGHHRERLLPAIAAIEQRMQVLAVDGDVDHRLHPGELLQRYWHGRSDEPLAHVFKQHAAGAVETSPLLLGTRELGVIRRSDNVLWCGYEQLCEAPLAANDYIELCDRFEHILLSEVPVMAADAASTDAVAMGTEDGSDSWLMADRTLPPLSVRDNGVRRFIALVDECYDRNIPLWLDAEVAIDALYPKTGYLAFAFRRTESRLLEMQFRRYGAAIND